MLAPHHGENAQFGVIRRAPEDALDLLELLRREIVLADQIRGVMAGSLMGLLSVSRRLWPSGFPAS
jgi:hypothetical protein